MGWKKEIECALTRPMRIGELLLCLGFDEGATFFDVTTNLGNMFKPLNGSFVGSQAQRVLGEMVRKGYVEYQRAANMDNWYGLSGQRFPRVARKRSRTLREMAVAVYALTGDLVREKPDFDGIGDADVWVEIEPFVLSLHEKGWEVADGDPVCNWCFNTFEKVFPMNVSPIKIARSMRWHWHNGNMVKA